MYNMSIIQHYGMAYIYIIYTRVQNHWLCQCIAYHTCTHKGIAQMLKVHIATTPVKPGTQERSLLSLSSMPGEINQCKTAHGLC